jgi:hypothetical protein
MINFWVNVYTSWLVSCGQAGVAGEFVEGGVVGAVGGASP